MEQRNPAYARKPVILVHFTVAEGVNIAWCAEEEYTPVDTNAYPDTPRVFCPACVKAGMR